MTLETQFLPLTIEELPQCAADHKKQGFRLVQMLCVNTEEGIDMQYSFMKGNTIENHTITGVQKNDEIPSITDKYISAFVFENEAHDLFGVNVVGNALDFGGKFYQVSHSEPMTIISPAQKEAREKAAKIKAAQAAKAAKDAQATIDVEAKEADMEAKLADMDPEKAEKVRKAMEAKAAKAAAEEKGGE